MKSYKIIAFLVCTAALGLGFFTKPERKQVPSDNYVADVLFSLGEAKPAHFIQNATPEMIQKGKELIHFGKTTNSKGKNTKQLSKFFKCISCHNTVKEEDDLSKVNPEKRLAYAVENDIPFLQGSTFYGIVNRESWYNDDYVKKYGDLVKPARSSLKESIQLCAIECSQGRPVEDWEMEAILAYFWSIGLKETDVKMSSLLANSKLDASERIAKIKEQYLQKSPATFTEVPENKEKGYPNIIGNAQNGELIYKKSCQHCHREKGESDVVLDTSKPTLNWLKRNITSDSDLSIYQIIRHGTYAASGHREYMPLYTKEKMSDQQIEDLRAFIELER